MSWRISSAGDERAVGFSRSPDVRDQTPEVCELLSLIGGDDSQFIEVVLRRVPHQGLVHCFEFVMIDIAGSCDSRPVCPWMPAFQLFGQATRCLRDDSRALNHGWQDVRGELSAARPYSGSLAVTKRRSSYQGETQSPRRIRLALMGSWAITPS